MNPCPAAVVLKAPFQVESFSRIFMSDALKCFFQFQELCYFLTVKPLCVEKSMELWVEDEKLWEM